MSTHRATSTLSRDQLALCSPGGTKAGPSSVLGLFPAACAASAALVGLTCIMAEPWFLPSGGMEASSSNEDTLLIILPRRIAQKDPESSPISASSSSSSTKEDSPRDSKVGSSALAVCTS